MAELVADTKDVQFKWKHDVGGDITALKAGVYNGVPVVAVGVGKELHVFDAVGKEMLRQNLTTQGRIYVIEFGDVDDDEMDEIILGLGWMETDELDLNALYPPPDGIPEEEDVLYKILKSKGSLYIVDGGSASKRAEVDEWVRQAVASDVDGDRETELLVVMGGYANNYYKKYTDLTFSHWVCEDEWNLRRRNLEEAECICPTCIWIAEDVQCYENESEEVCDWEETKGKGWALSEKPSANGSIVVYDKYGELESNSPMQQVNETFPNAEIANLYNDLNDEVIVGAGDEVYVFFQDGKLVASFLQKAEVKSVFAADLNEDDSDEIVFTYVNATSGGHGIAALDRNGRMMWAYPLNSTAPIDAVYVLKPESGELGELLMTSEGVLYAFGGGGRLVWSYSLKQSKYYVKKADRLSYFDLDGNSMAELVVASEKSVYVYELRADFLEKQLAESEYLMGSEAFESGDYSRAQTYLLRARQHYEAVGYDEGIDRCDALLQTISTSHTQVQKSEADSKYVKALSYYGVKNYDLAKEYLVSARAIYSGIGDLEGVSKCDSLIKTIDELQSRSPTTTKTTLEPTTTSTRPQSGQSMESMIAALLPIAAIVFVLLIVASVVFAKKAGPQVDTGGGKIIYGLNTGKKKEKKTLEVRLGGGKDKKKKAPEKKKTTDEKPADDQWTSIDEYWKEIDDISDKSNKP